jgi:hypothetical protein
MKLWTAISAALMASVLACAPTRPAAAPIDVGPAAESLAPESAPMGLRRSVVADEYFWLRAKALEGEAPAPFGPALAAMRELREDLAADPTAWEDLEVPLGTVERAADLQTVYGALPVMRDVGGKMVPLRARAQKLAQAMAATEAAYQRGPYHDHASEIAHAAKELNTRLFPKLEEILRTIDADMNLPGTGRPIVITLVGDAPYPGIFAADDRGQTMASFVRVRGLEGGALVETVLHELLHAIDEVTVRSPTAMNMLRDALARRGIDKSDPNVEMAVNTVTFAEAASLVRRFVEPTHRPLGESGFYTLYPPASAIVVAWERHVEGEGLETTADAVAKAVAQAP